MIETVVKLGAGILGSFFGVEMANMTNKCPQPKVYQVGKEIAGGLIFGYASMYAADAAYAVVNDYIHRKETSN